MRFMMIGLLVATMAFTARAEGEPATAAEAAATATHGPKLVCEEATYDFGNSDSTKTIEHTYILRNEGDATLEISQARPSCGCTIASLSEKTVPPGGESKVTAQLNLAGRSGQQHKTIMVECNDPTQPNFMLTLQGTVVTAINVNPDRALFNQIASDANVNTAIDVTSSEATPFHVQSAESSSPYYTATLETIEDGKSYRVVVATKPPLPAGMANGNVRLKTDSASRPVIDVPIYGNVTADLIVAPQEIILDTQEAEHPVTRFVVIRPGNAKPFKLESVEPPDAGIKVDISPFGGDGYRIQLGNVVVSKDLEGKSLRIVTDVENMKEILIPFRIINATPEPHV